MIETFKDRTTGEIFQNQTVLCEFYVFWREDMLREQDKAPNVVCVLTGDWSGIRLADDKQRISPPRLSCPIISPIMLMNRRLKRCGVTHLPFTNIRC